ncbi:hypothetical protein BJV77DRAFT_1035834 [Russula vinacea]|nr:hypothetical protein BJV77DRAFT_1037996 [Russula vinacea]KAH9984800.1 hypothetical protein BJV77DRAFT_1035834 [Russula vinacea]
MPQILRQEASLLLPVGACASLHCPAVMPEGSVAQLDSARVAVHSTGCNRHREVAAELGAEAPNSIKHPFPSFPAFTT